MTGENHANIVEMDITQMIVNQNGTSACRPHLKVFVDKFSRKILDISVYEPSGDHLTSQGADKCIKD